MINYKKYINELLPINNQEIFLNIFDNIFSKNKVDLEDYHLEINADNINSIVNLFLNILDKYLVIKDSEITQNLIDLYQQIVRKTSYSRYIYSKVFEKDINEMDRFDLFVFISNCILDDKNYLCKDKKLNLTKHKSYVEIINNYDFFEKLLIEFPFFFKSLALFLYSLNTINIDLNIDLINKIIINEASCSSDYKVNIEVDVALFFKNSTEIINNFFNVNNEFVYKSINSKENLPVILNKLCYSYKFKSDDNLFFLNELISKALKENIIDIDFFKLNSSVKLNENNLLDAVNELRAKGYEDDYIVDENNLICTNSNKCLTHNDFEVEDAFQFEITENAIDSQFLFTIKDKQTQNKGLLIDLM